jgi:hypothetical protein
MKNTIPFAIVLVLFSSCVSKKKYSALKQQHDQTLSDKSGLEDVLARLATENDSLKKQIVYLDTMLRSEREKENAPARVTSSAGTVVSKAKSNLSKTAEYDKKALYIYNLPGYIYWPGKIKTDKFLIGIIGDSPMNAALGSYMYGKNIQKLPAVVEPYNPAPGKFYHIVFVAESRQKDFQKIKKELQGKPVLLVAENKYLDKAGAHICLYVDGDKIKFSVNKKDIEKNGLNVSEQLIKLSDTN